LISLKSEGVADDQLRRALEDVVESLNATNDQTNLFGAPPKDSSFSHYEQVSALEEVMAALKDKDIVRHLSHLLVVADQEEREHDINEAVEFFFALESRALHHYNRQIGAREA